MRLFRGAPVPMTTEGVGETSEFRRRPQLFVVRLRARRNGIQKLRTLKLSSHARLAGRFQALVARTPILRPLHSLLDLAGGLGYFPFGGTFLHAIACGRLTGRGLALCLGWFIRRG